MTLARTERVFSVSAGGHGTGSFASGSFTPANDSLLVVIVTALSDTNSGMRGTDLTLSNSESLTQTNRLATTQGTAQSQGISIWTMPVVTGVSMTVTADCGTFSIRKYRIHVLEYTGHDTSTPTGATASGLDTDEGAGNITLSAAPDSASEVIAVLNGEANAPTVTPGTGWTELREDLDTGWTVFQDQIRGDSTSTSVDWIDISAGSTGTEWVLAALEIKNGGPPPQTAAPTSTISSGSWTPSGAATLWEAIDETTPSDTDYDTDTSAGSTMEVKFASVTDPAVSTGHKLKYRISAADAGSLVVSLRQGASTEIATETRNPAPVAATTYTLTLSGGQADSITDYTDLRMRVVSNDAGATSTAATFPTTAVTASETPWSDNDWTAAGDITADDTSYASITAPSYDSPDQSFVLKAKGFDFSAIPDGATINGIEVVVACWYANGTNSGDLAQLLDTAGAKVGTNKWATPQALTTTVGTTYTLGGASDNWGNSLTAAWVKDPDFGIALGFAATGANSDVFVDYATIKVYYTASPDFRVYWAQWEVPAASALALTQTARLDNAAAFFAPTVTPGAVTLTQSSRLDNANAFFAPTVTATYALAAQRLDNTQSFFGPTVAAGAVTLTQSSRFDNSPTFFGPTITTGAVALTQNARFDNAATFFAATVTPGAVTLSPPLLTNTAAFFGPTVTLGAAGLVQTARLDNSPTFFAPTVSVGPVTITPSRLDNTAGFFGPAVTSLVTLTQSARVDNTNAFYAATVTPGAVTLTQASRLDNSSSFFAPTVTAGAVTLSPNRLDNSQAFFGPTVTQGAITLTQTARLDNSPAFFSPTVTPGSVTLSPGLFTNGQSFFGPTISQGVVLTQTARFDNATVFNSPTVAPGAVALTQSGRFDNAGAFFAPTVLATYTLTPARLENTASFFAPTVSPGVVTLTQSSRFDNSAGFFSPTVTTGPVTLSPSLLSNSSTFFSPTVSHEGQLTQTARFDNTNVFYSPTITTGAVVLTQTARLDNASAVFGPTADYHETAHLYWASISAQQEARLYWVLANPGAVADLNAGYTIEMPAQADLAASYNVIASVQADLAANYSVEQTVQRDLAATYDTLTSAQADISSSYVMGGKVFADLGAVFYNVGGPTISDLTALYSLGTVVQSTLSCSYLIRTSAQSDLAAAYDAKNTAAQDLAATYNMGGSSTSDLDGAYSLLGAAESDLLGTYGVVGAINADLAAVYGIFNAPSADLAGNYSMDGRVLKDLSANYWLRLFHLTPDAALVPPELEFIGATLDGDPATVPKLNPDAAIVRRDYWTAGV